MLQSERKRAAKVIFYCPDGVMANGSLERAVFLAEQGKRAVHGPGPRISEGEAELHLKPLIRIESPISPRDMLKTVFPILHPEMFRYFLGLRRLFLVFPNMLLARRRRWLSECARFISMPSWSTFPV